MGQKGFSAVGSLFSDRLLSYTGPLKKTGSRKYRIAPERNWE